jgi:methionine-rich copper-binding protein CopC
VAFGWLQGRGLRGHAVLAGALATALVLLPGEVGSHAFVSRTDPRASATLGEPPARVRIWFDGPVETMFVQLRVENERKQRVDKNDARLNPDDNTQIEVGLSPLPPGRYRVFWGVVARDGHRREGSFSFLVK